MTNTNKYSGYHYPTQIISHTVWLYHRFTLSFRDIEELLAARGIIVGYETVRNWCLKFGAKYCNKIKKNRGKLGDILARYPSVDFLANNRVIFNIKGNNYRLVVKLCHENAIVLIEWVGTLAKYSKKTF
jgi:mRNA-degrading endonuclease HigB of HigAB toxin-antitoxin module